MVQFQYTIEQNKMSMIDKFGFNLIHKSPVVSGPHYEIEKLSRMYYIANRGIQEKWML